jgi:hypothetical protein
VNDLRMTLTAEDARAIHTAWDGQATLDRIAQFIRGMAAEDRRLILPDSLLPPGEMAKWKVLGLRSENAAALNEALLEAGYMVTRTRPDPHGDWAGKVTVSW